MRRLETTDMNEYIQSLEELKTAVQELKGIMLELNEKIANLID